MYVHAGSRRWRRRRRQIPLTASLHSVGSDLMMAVGNGSKGRTCRRGVAVNAKQGDFERRGRDENTHKQTHLSIVLVYEPQQGERLMVSSYIHLSK